MLKGSKVVVSLRPVRCKTHMEGQPEPNLTQSDKRLRGVGTEWSSQQREAKGPSVCMG